MKILSTLFIISLALFSFACKTNSEGQNEDSAIESPKVNIHEASFFGNVEAIKQHIAYGSDLNVKDEYGSTPLNIAITFNKKDVADELIKGGADLEIPATDGSTPLISAAFFGRTSIVNALIEGGANLDARNSYNASALDNVTMSFEQLKPVYDQLSRDLGPLGFKLDYEDLQVQREEIKKILTAAEEKK